MGRALGVYGGQTEKHAPTTLCPNQLESMAPAPSLPEHFGPVTAVSPKGHTVLV